MIDQDKHEIRLLQELYLEDGDLGQGTKRQRNFRWRNIDDVSFHDDQTNNLDGEGDDFNFETDLRKKMERIEREIFFKESQVSYGVMSSLAFTCNIFFIIIYPGYPVLIELLSMRVLQSRSSKLQF